MSKLVQLLLTVFIFISPVSVLTATADAGEMKLGGLTTAGALFTAVAVGNAALVAKLLKDGADPNHLEPCGLGPLHQAMFASSSMVELLLDSGADPNLETRSEMPGLVDLKWTPLFFAVGLNRVDLATQLLRRGARLDARDANGHSPVFYGVQRGNAAMVETLRTRDNASASFSAIIPAKAYFPKGVGTQPEPIAPLFQAVMSNDEQAVTEFLRQGADPNERSPMGWTSLHRAMLSTVRISQLLLQYGADVNSRVADTPGGPSNGWTPLYFAVYYGRADLVKELLGHGARSDIVDRSGKRCLEYAISSKNDTLIEMLKNPARCR